MKSGELFEIKEEEVWCSAVYCKAGLSVLLTPLPRELSNLMDMVLDEVSFNFYIVIMILLISCFSKQWREEKANKVK